MGDALAELELGDELAWEPLRIVPPGPWAGHIPFAFWLMKALRPATFVELGTHSGNSYFAFCQAMTAFIPGGRSYAVDTWIGDEHAGNYGEEVFADVSAFNTEHFRQSSTLLRTTFDDAGDYFPDGAVDLLHIDGMHSYEAVKHDFEAWKSRLSSRAVVVFHDTNVRERGFGVWRFWRELSTRHPSFEFDHSNGLGVLGVGREQPPMLQALFALSQFSDTAGAFRRRIAARGEAFQRQVEIAELQLQLREAQGAVAASSAHVDELAWREALLNSQRDVIQSKDAVSAALSNLVGARSEALAIRDRMIEARDAEAADLMKQLRHQAGEERRVRDEMQAGYEAAIAGINADREALKAEVIRQQVTTMRYVGSTSWRLTRPLRVATRVLRGRGMAPEPAFVPSLPAMGSPTPVAEPAAPADVTAVTPAKLALRAPLKARLDAFLSGPDMLRLPSAATPDVSIILVTYNQAELTFGCLGSIVETLADTLFGAPFGVEVVIADNASTDQTAALLDRLAGATIIRNTANLHFLKAVNLAASKARGRTLLLLNNDAQLLPGSLASALRTLDSDPAIGAVGGRIILPDGTLQEAGSIIWRDGACSGYARGQDPTTPDVMFQRDVDYCSGAFLLTPAALFERMGGFDERFAPAYYEETDYCVRLWEGGYRVVYDPDAAIIHYEFGSSTADGDALRPGIRHGSTGNSRPARSTCCRRAPHARPRLGCWCWRTGCRRRSLAPAIPAPTACCTSWRTPARKSRCSRCSATPKPGTACTRRWTSASRCSSAPKPRSCANICWRGRGISTPCWFAARRTWSSSSRPSGRNATCWAAPRCSMTRRRCSSPAPCNGGRWTGSRRASRSGTGWSRPRWR